MAVAAHMIGSIVRMVLATVPLQPLIPPVPYGSNTRLMAASKRSYQRPLYPLSEDEAGDTIVQRYGCRNGRRLLGDDDE